MPATPSDIARFTKDGTVVTSPTDPAVAAAIATAHVNARSGAEREIEMFHDNVADAQFFLDERFAYLSRVAPTHMGIEVEEALVIDGGVQIAPVIPAIRIVERALGIDELVRVRALAAERATDRFSVEVLS